MATPLLTPDDVDAAAPLLGKIITVVKWILGALATGYAGGKVIVRASVKAGEEKRRYEELREDVDQLQVEQKLYLTIEDHRGMTKLCHAELASLGADRLNAVVADIREDMGTMNANLCHLMGHLQVDPLTSPKRRRRSDG